MTDQLTTTREALDQVRAKRQKVERLAEAPSDYVARAGARIQIEDLDSEIARLAGELPALEAAAAHQALLDQLAALAEEGQAALRALEQVQAEFDTMLLPILERYSDARQRQHTARQAFYHALPKDAAGILADLEATGADLGGVLVNLTETRDKPFDRPYKGASRFPAVLRLAMHTEAARRLGHALMSETNVIALPEERTNDQ
jgi:hypothetical protein